MEYWGTKHRAVWSDVWQDSAGTETGTCPAPLATQATCSARGEEQGAGELLAICPRLVRAWLLWPADPPGLAKGLPRPGRKWSATDTEASVYRPGLFPRWKAEAFLLVRRCSDATRKFTGGPLSLWRWPTDIFLRRWSWARMKHEYKNVSEGKKRADQDSPWPAHRCLNTEYWRENWPLLNIRDLDYTVPFASDIRSMM